jgi:serine/threonine protein kinase
MLKAFSEGAEAPSDKAPAFDDEPAPEAAAPPRPERPVVPSTDLDQVLEGVFAPATDSAQAPAGTPKLAEDVPGLGELRKPVPPPASRTAIKFQAAAPKIAADGESRMMLDLASLAEDALSLPPEQREPTAPAYAAGVGHDFGPYRLLEKVATGGMAEVFRAKRTGVEGFEKVVALKRILPHLSDNKEFVDMFVDEAKMVAGLTHPNIVQIFDLGKIDDTYFIAMEYIAGRDLRSILRRAKDKGIPIPLELCVLIAGRVAAALEYAHRKKDEAGRALKIVHRDVSPQNILIAFEGEVKLTDFGIAKATSKATSTDRGALRGKLLYMSPEQALGKPMDRRADVFSLGVCFYEMITDRKPFMGTSEMGILEMVRECRVSPPSLVNPRVPERIERVVMKALDRDPERRYQDAGELLRDLEHTLTLRQPPTALELARFMEVLFESEERGVAVAPEEASVEPAPAAERDHLEIDLEPDEAPAAPAAQEPDAKPAPGQAGFGRLLKKFGIK